MRRSRAITPFKRAVRKVGYIPISGRWVKLLAPQHKRRGPSASGPWSIVIVDLIPFLGDAICYLPLVDALRAQHPSAKITFVCAPPAREILQNYPAIDEVLTYPGHRLGLSDRMPILRDYFEFFRVARFARSLSRTHAFDVALIPRGGADPFFSAHCAWLMNVPSIFGYSARLEPERLYMQYGAEVFYAAYVREVRHLHESTRALEVAEVAGLLPACSWSADEPVDGLMKLADAQDYDEIARVAELQPTEEYAILSPGAGAAHRRWPLDRFREIAGRLVRETSLSVLITGTSAECALGEALVQAGDPRIRNLSGRLTLLQLIGLFKSASLFVGNDSGAGHIAGALGVPTISLNAYPATENRRHHQSPERNRPRGPRVYVVTPSSFLPPCTEECLADEVHCLGQIEVGQVWCAATRALERG